MESIDRGIRSILNNDNLTTDKAIASIEEYVLTPEVKTMGYVKITISDRKGFEIRAQQCPLDMYYNRKQLGDPKDIGKQRYRAGDRFYREFFISGLTPNMIVDLERVRGTEKKDYIPNNEHQYEARLAWRKALEAVNGEPGKYLALNVLCYGYPLADLTPPNYRRGTDAMPRLLEVLDDLVKHYFVDSSEKKGHNHAR